MMMEFGILGVRVSNAVGRDFKEGHNFRGRARGKVLGRGYSCRGWVVYATSPEIGDCG
jgi:hypothetical protein